MLSFEATIGLHSNRIWNQPRQFCEQSRERIQMTELEQKPLLVNVN